MGITTLTYWELVWQQFCPTGASSVPKWGKHVAQHGQARCPYWAEFMPSGCPKSWCRNIHILVIRIPFVWFSVAWQFLSRIQTIQTICWQLPGSQLSVYQNITTKNQMVWQFFWKFLILLKISVMGNFYSYRHSLLLIKRQTKDAL